MEQSQAINTPVKSPTVHVLSHTARIFHTDAPVQLVKVRLKEQVGPKEGQYTVQETNGVSVDLLVQWRERIHEDDIYKLEQAIRLNTQLQASPEHQEELMRRHAALPTAPQEDDLGDDEHEVGWDLEGVLEARNRLSVGMAYGTIPSWEEAEPLLPPSSELLEHQKSTVKRGVGISAASMAINAATHGGVGQGLNVIHSLNQGRKLADAYSSAQSAETQAPIRTLAFGRGKQAVSSGLSSAASVSTGMAVGAAIGSAIPVPVLGTLTGMAVGALAGFITGKVVQKGVEKAIVDKRKLYFACLDIHEMARAGNEEAISVFDTYSIDRAVIYASDGWKALVAKVGAEAPGR